MTVRERDYDRAYDRDYPIEIAAPAPPAPEVPTGPGAGWGDTHRLVPVTWHGMELDPGNVDEWFTAIVENVEGWYDTAPLNGSDTERALADGGAWGLKVIGPREITITGAAVGPRARVMNWRDRIAGLAAEREPAELAITDPWLNLTRTAMVRAGTGAMSHAFLGGWRGFRYQIAVTAADPILYGAAWKSVTLRNTSAGESGRPYARVYTHPRQVPPPANRNGWTYEMSYPPGSSAFIANDGDTPAPVFIVYDGDLSATILTDGADSILLDSVGTGVQVAVDSATLVAEAPGGANRSAMVRPGSRTMFIPAFSTAHWHLYGQGSGSVTLSWRDAWL